MPSTKISYKCGKQLVRPFFPFPETGIVPAAPCTVVTVCIQTKHRLVPKNQRCTFIHDDTLNRPQGAQAKGIQRHVFTLISECFAHPYRQWTEFSDNRMRLVKQQQKRRKSTPRMPGLCPSRRRPLCPRRQQQTYHFQRNQGQHQHLRPPGVRRAV